MHSAPASRARGGRPSILPPSYDGKTAWKDYLVQYEMISDINGWDDEERAMYVVVN